jgi:hypothetical protein
MSPSPNSDHSAFRDPQFALVHAYTRAQALADGFQVDVSTTAREAGITFPVFLTRAVFDQYVTVPEGVTAQDDVTVPEGVTAQDEAGRLWDIVWMLRFAILRARPGTTGGKCGSHRVPVALYVRNDNHRARLVKLVATCGPLDLDDPRPAITVMLPDED